MSDVETVCALSPTQNYVSWVKLQMQRKEKKSISLLNHLSAFFHLNHLRVKTFSLDKSPLCHVIHRNSLSRKDARSTGIECPLTKMNRVVQIAKAVFNHLVCFLLLLSYLMIWKPWAEEFHFHVMTDVGKISFSLHGSLKECYSICVWGRSIGFNTSVSICEVVVVGVGVVRHDYSYGRRDEIVVW